METLDALQSRARRLLAEIASLGEFRPGTLHQRFTQCGKPSCHCAGEDSPGHPGWQLVWSRNGKSVCRGIPKQAVERTRVQLLEHQRFKTLVREYTEVNESMCDLQLRSRRREKKRYGTGTAGGNA